MKTFKPTKKQIQFISNEIGYKLKQLGDIISIEEYDNTNCWFVKFNESYGEIKNIIIIFPTHNHLKSNHINYSLIVEENFGLGEHSIKLYDKNNWFGKLKFCN